MNMRNIIVKKVLWMILFTKKGNTYDAFQKN